MEEIVASRIRQFEITYGISPNGLVMHWHCPIYLERTDTGMLFLGIPVYRTFDLPRNEIKFVI
jgi:hypothetical protein